MPPVVPPEKAMAIGRAWFSLAEQYEAAEMHEEALNAHLKSDWWLAYARTLSAVNPETPT